MNRDEHPLSKYSAEQLRQSANELGNILEQAKRRHAAETAPAPKPVGNSWPWYVLQIVVFFAIIVSDIEYKWSPSGYVTTLLAGFGSYAASCLVFSILNWRTELVPPAFRKRQ